MRNQKVFFVSLFQINYMKTKLVLIATFLFNLLNAQNYQIDTTFGDNGRIDLDFNQSSAVMLDMIKLSDGRTIVLANMNGLRLIRLNQNGSLDTNFGTNGSTSDFSLDYDLSGQLKVLDNGQYLVCTSYKYNNSLNQTYENPVFLKFNSDGTFDTTFGNNGKLLYDFSGLAIDIVNCYLDSNDKLFFLGSVKDVTPQSSDFFVAKFDINGQIAQDFGANGFTRLNVGTNTDVTFQNVDVAKSLQAMPNGDLIILGDTSNNPITFGNMAIIKTNSNGQVDNSFGSNGRSIINFDVYSYATSALTLNNAIYIVGNTRETVTNNPNFPLKLALAKVDSSGILDSSFGTNGKRIVVDNDPSYNVIPVSAMIASSNKILIASRKNNLSLLRFGTIIRQFNDNGDDDFNFGNNGKIHYFYTTSETDPNPNTEAFSVPGKIMMTTQGDLFLGGHFSPPNSFETMLLFLVKYKDSNLQTVPFESSSILISPNPFKNIISLQFPDAFIANYIMEMYDCYGRKVYSYPITNSASAVSIPIDENLPKGNYVMKIMSEQETTTYKIIKQ